MCLRGRDGNRRTQCSAIVFARHVFTWTEIRDEEIVINASFVFGLYIIAPVILKAQNY